MGFGTIHFVKRLALAVLLFGCAPPEKPSAHVETQVLAPVLPKKREAPVVRVLVGGDVMPHRSRLEDPERLKNALSPLDPLFAKADVVVVNYETATGSPSRLDPRSLALAASAEWMAELPNAHVDAITIANNHVCDIGTRGLDRTIGAAHATGLAAIGADDVDPWAPKVLFDKDGRTLCAVAWTTFHNQDNDCARSRKVALAKEGSRGEVEVTSAIKRAKKVCTATLAILHGGAEYEPQTGRIMSMVRTAAEAGAAAVLVHHPHVVTPARSIETKDGRRVPVFPSLGNLVSNQGESWKIGLPATQRDRRLVCLNAWTRLGMIADLRITLSDVPEVRYGQRLIWTDNTHADDRKAPHPHIAARPFDRTTDAAISTTLARDTKGPTAVLEDSCNLQGIDAEPYCR